MRLVLLIIVFIVIVLVFAVVLLNIVDKFYYGYEVLNETYNNITDTFGNMQAENHDLIQAIKPAFHILDLTLSIVIIFLFAGIFIYSRRR